MKSNKGYSLIEIAIGLAVFTLLVFCVGTIVNVAFSNYRVVHYRNRALEIAMNKIESILLSDEVPIASIEMEDLGGESPIYTVITDVQNVLLHGEPSDVYHITVTIDGANANANKLGLPIEIETLKAVLEGTR